MRATFSWDHVSNTNLFANKMKTSCRSDSVRSSEIKHYCRGILLASVLLALCSQLAYSQPITPVWEYLVTQPSPLPILTNYIGWPDDEENGDGKSLMDCIGPMRRYDANRLLLGIRENGIDETQFHNTNLAGAYP